MENTSLGEKLVELRTDRGLTQLQLSELLHIGRATYAYYETGKRTPDLSFLLTICKFYGIEISELINENTIPLYSNNSDNNSGGVGKAGGAMVSIAGGSMGETFLGKSLASASMAIITHSTAKPPFSKAEKELIANFRQLTPDNQDEISHLVKYKLRRQKKKE